MELERVAKHRPRRAEAGTHVAAVLAPVLDRDGEAHLLFTKRADHLGEHPGQMSFPGGSREPSDDTLWETAVREAGEEIGLRSEEPKRVGRLDDILTVTDYAVTPYVARIPDREYIPDHREVAEIAVLPVAGLLDSSNHEAEHRDHPAYGEFVVHYFHVNGYTVWGATARIVVQLLEIAAGWEPPAPTEHVLDTDPGS